MNIEQYTCQCEHRIYTYINCIRNNNNINECTILLWPKLDSPEMGKYHASAENCYL